MTRDELIKQCRYYNGEEKNPYDLFPLTWYWDMERVYVENNGEFVGETEYYKNINGKIYPGIPFALLMVMLTSWGKSTYSIREQIANFYEVVDDYLSVAEDHFPKDKIPTGDEE